MWRDCGVVLSPRRLQVDAENLHDTLFLLYYDMMIMLLHTMTQNVSHCSSFVSSLAYVRKQFAKIYTQGLWSNGAQAFLVICSKHANFMKKSILIL